MMVAFAQTHLQVLTSIYLVDNKLKGIVMERLAYLAPQYAALLSQAYATWIYGGWKVEPATRFENECGKEWKKTGQAFKNCVSDKKTNMNDFFEKNVKSISSIAENAMSALDVEKRMEVAKKLGWTKTYAGVDKTA